ERWYNPTNFGTAGLYRPPFNKLSRLRDAGRININTVYDDQILLAAMGHHRLFDAARQNGFLNKVFRSRQGYGAVNTPAYVMDPNFPTMFANPFRPFDAADLMPDVPPTQFSMRKNGQLAGPGQPRGMPVEATFFRPDPDPAAGGIRVPLFDQIANETEYFNPAHDFDHMFRNTERNAYFRYQVMQKLGNTFSTTSNCFAVWMTMGFFEVEDLPSGIPDAAHPDALRLGQEIGADSGEIVRHRAFYIIDRSVPVGHAPGQKLNSENCILLRRMIE
ncbi:MAG: hypothetical protein L0211_03805, partial [Planctomycetaceae bacterium]|nr:hypothetical protein [Planctomycetaceae bacterium]